MSPLLVALCAALILAIILGAFSRLRPQEKLPWGLILAALCAVAIFASFSISASEKRRLRIFVIDGSLSFQRAHNEIRGTLKDSCADLGPNDRCALIVFSQDAGVLIPPVRPSEFKPDSVDWSREGGSHIERGIEAALQLSSSSAEREIILVSDGLETAGKMERASARCQEQGARLFSYCPVLEAVEDLALSKVTGPKNLAINDEAEFIVSLFNRSPRKIEARLELTAYRGEQEKAAWAFGLEIKLAPRQSLSRRILRRVKEAGLYRLEAQVFPRRGKDQFKENNKKSHWFTVGSPKKAVILCSPKSHAPRLIANAGYQALSLSPGPKLQERFRALFTSAPEILVIDDQSIETLKPIVPDIDSWVSNHGIGLLVFGGPHSFGPGNYSGSSFEETLPVLSRPPSDPGQALTLSLAVDASGSMKDRYGDALEFGVEKSYPILRPGDSLFLTAFAESIRLRKEKLGREDFDKALMEFRELEPNDGTDLKLALSTLLTDLIEAPQEDKKLGILVSDAQAKISPDGLQALKQQIQSLAARSEKAPARIVLLLIGEAESLAVLKKLESDLGAKSVKVEALTIANTKDALKTAISSSVAKLREEVARGQFPIEITELGKGFLGSRPVEGFLKAYNRTRLKAGAQVFARTLTKKETLLAKRAHGSGTVLTFSSSLSLWLDPLVQTTSGRRFLTTLPTLLRSRVNREWSISATRVDSGTIQVRAEHPSYKVAGEGKLVARVSDGSRRLRERFLPSEPGVQLLEAQVSPGPVTVSVGIGEDVLGVLTVPGTEAAEVERLEPDLDRLKQVARGTGGKKLTALPLRARDLQREDREQKAGRRSLGPLFAVALVLALLWVASGGEIGKIGRLNFFSNK